MRELAKELQQIMVSSYIGGEDMPTIGKRLGFGSGTVCKILKRHGVKARPQRGRQGAIYRGADNRLWAGDRIKRDGKYWVVYMPDHPRRDSEGRVWEHIVVAEKQLGRFIGLKERVHHIDLDTLNNKPENLYVCVNRVEHNAVHNSLDAAVGRLIKQGIIKFGGGRYYYD